MSIRKPIKILSYSDAADVGAGSVAGMTTKTFNLPQDTDALTMKFQASLVGTSASVTFQTTDDGGTTWYDVARTKVVTVNNNTTADWTYIPVLGPGQRTFVNTASSTTSGQTAASIGGTIGSAAASSLGAGQYSGLPVLDTFARIGVIFTGNVTTNDKLQVDIYAHNQSNRA